MDTSAIFRRPLHLQVSESIHLFATHSFLFLIIRFTHLHSIIIDSFVDTISTNLKLLEQECGRNFSGVLQLIIDTNTNLRVLEDQASLAMDLFQCKNINNLYVNTVHEAGCTYSVNAIAWMLACSIVISICGLIMIMLRSSYLPEQFLVMSSEWNNKPNSTGSPSDESCPCDESLSSNAGDEGIAPGVLDNPSEIQARQQLSEVPQSQIVPVPRTPPRIFVESNFDSVECSPERNSQQMIATNDDYDDNNMKVPGSAEI